MLHRKACRLRSARIDEALRRLTDRDAAASRRGLDTPGERLVGRFVVGPSDHRHRVVARHSKRRDARAGLRRPPHPDYRPDGAGAAALQRVPDCGASPGPRGRRGRARCPGSARRAALHTRGHGGAVPSDARRCGGWGRRVAVRLPAHGRSAVVCPGGAAAAQVRGRHGVLYSSLITIKAHAQGGNIGQLAPTLRALGNGSKHTRRAGAQEGCGGDVRRRDGATRRAQMTHVPHTPAATCSS